MTTTHTTQPGEAIMKRMLFIAVVSLSWLGYQAAPSRAQPAAPGEPITFGQEQVLQKYKRFEEVLLRMAELTDDPRRAALLRKAVAQSKDDLIGVQLERLIALLAEERLGVAVADQGHVQEDLAKLLGLLLSEERDKKIQDEMRRVKEYLKRLNALIKDQQAARGETAGGAEMRRMAERQADVADKTERLAKEMKEAEESSSSESSGEPTESEPADGEPSEGEPSEGEASEGEPGDGKPSEGQPSEGQPSEGQPSEGQPSEGQPSEGQPSEGQPSESQPAESSESQSRRRLEAAEERMREAQRKLDEANRQDAVERQDAALRELEQAKAELEEILRQLREEERERMLVMLEARFRKMLALQQEVYEGTLLVDRTAAERRGRDDEIEAGRLGNKEAVILIEVERALTLLREEGSAAAFPEAVEQMRDDVEQIVHRLRQAKVGAITQGLEEDVIAALEEMIGALEKARKDLEQKKSEPMPPGEPSEPALVDQLAELKMIRALQMRVNRRTERYNKLVDGEIGQADQPELLDALRRLAEREDRIFQVTRDIVTGRNQ